MSTPSINDLFDQLDERRHLPKYKFELRSSPFFQLFLLDVLNAHYKSQHISFKKPLIPEFPIRKSVINESPTEQYDSFNADFFALSEDGKHALLIELKTDMGSSRSRQHAYLKKASTKELRELVEGIVCISKSKHADGRKYLHLLSQLSLLGLVCVPDFGQHPNAFQKKKPGLGTALNEVRNCVTVTGIKPQIAYILPRPPMEKEKKDLAQLQLSSEITYIRTFAKIIYFQEFADAIKRQGEIGERFAKSLLEWAESDPGTQPPAKP